MAQWNTLEMEGMMKTVGQAMFEATMMRDKVTEAEESTEKYKESLVNQEVKVAEDRNEAEKVRRKVEGTLETWKMDAKVANGEWVAWYEWYMEGGQRWVHLGEEA